MRWGGRRPSSASEAATTAAWKGDSVTPLCTETANAPGASCEACTIGRPSGLITRSAPHARTSRTSFMNGNTVVRRPAVRARIGRVTPSSKPASSDESPQMTPPSSVWRMKWKESGMNGFSFSVTMIWPRTGRSGARMPSCGASIALPSPAARSTRAAP